MGKYSSDSENEKRGSKRGRRRSSSSDSSDSRNRRRRHHKSNRRSHSKSRSKYSRRSRSRSRSLSYHSTKSKSYRSKSRERHRDRRHRTKSRSRDRYKSRRSRSRSKSYIREFVGKPKRRSSSASSSSSSRKSAAKSIKPSASTIIKPEVTFKRDISSPGLIVIDSDVLEELNADKFSQKDFSSSRVKKVPDNIVIDLTKNTIKVPELEPVEPDSIFHHSLFLNEEARMEKWVKELYSFRQKALQQGSK